MKNLLKFFLETEKLKEMPRTGWVWLEAKNPETIAAHLFRVTMMNWTLAQKLKLNLKKVIKISLAHDFCEVYSGDMTPYWGLLPKNKKKRKEVLKRWVRLPLKEKEKRGKIKFQKEKKAIEKLTDSLSLKLKKEIINCWLSYEKMGNREGRFVREGDKIETMIQAIEYFGVKGNTPVVGWWEEVEELVETPLFLEILKVIEEKFYYGEKRKDELEEIINFLLEIGKLKTMPRTLWLSMGIKNPETVSGHTFTTTLMTWILGNERKGLDLEKSLKMALSHEFPSVYTGDLITPFILPKRNEEKRKVFERWPRLKKIEKEKIFFEDYQKEKRAIEKLTENLETNLKKEIVGLWDEYKMNKTLEARFVNQVNVLAVLLQALLYQKKEKNLPIGWIWEWAFEKCEEPVILEFSEILKEKFCKSF